MGEQPDDIAVLAVELKLHLRLVLFEVLRAHDSILLSFSPSAPAGPNAAATRAPAGSSTAGSASPSRSAGSSRSAGATGTARAAARVTFTNEYRCTGLGPCSARAATCSSVTYPLCRSK